METVEKKIFFNSFFSQVRAYNLQINNEKSMFKRSFIIFSLIILKSGVETREV